MKREKEMPRPCEEGTSSHGGHDGPVWPLDREGEGEEPQTDAELLQTGHWGEADLRITIPGQLPVSVSGDHSHAWPKTQETCQQTGNTGPHSCTYNSSRHWNVLFSSNKVKCVVCIFYGRIDGLLIKLCVNKPSKCVDSEKWGAIQCLIKTGLKASSEDSI